MKVCVLPAKPSVNALKEQNLSFGKQSWEISKASGTVAIEKKGTKKGTSISTYNCSGNKLKEPDKITVLISQQ